MLLPYIMIVSVGRTSVRSTYCCKRKWIFEKRVEALLALKIDLGTMKIPFLPFPPHLKENGSEEGRAALARKINLGIDAKLI